MDWEDDGVQKKGDDDCGDTCVDPEEGEAGYYRLVLFADDASRQKTALQLLVAGMKCTGKDENPLYYLYQEYEVCVQHDAR